MGEVLVDLSGWEGPNVVGLAPLGVGGNESGGGCHRFGVFDDGSGRPLLEGVDWSDVSVLDLRRRGWRLGG